MGVTGSSVVETVRQKCAYLYSLYTGSAKLTVCYDEVIMLHSTDFKKTEFGAGNDVTVELTDVIMAVFYFSPYGFRAAHYPTVCV